MMVRQTRHTAIRAAARLSPILPGSRLSLAPWTGESKDLVKIGTLPAWITAVCLAEGIDRESGAQLSCPRRQERARASHLAPKKFDNQKKRVASSFLFVRRGTQSYDELRAAVPVRPRPCMMLGMINTSDILSIGENARACTSSVAGDPSTSAAENSSLPSRFSAGGC
jgi:hypothetical protein